MTVFNVFSRLCREPGEMLVKRWNWKSAIFSSCTRALVFFFANFTAGWRAATGAMVAEFLYRSVSAGFYGALTQAFREAEPEWAAGIAVMFLLPLTSHSIEFVIHLLRHTPNLATSIVSSVVFTMISTLFNVYAMRRGALIVGECAGSVGSDLRRIPRLIAGFLAAGPLAFVRIVSRVSLVRSPIPSADLTNYER